MNDKYYARRYKVIRKLRQQGYTNRQIAEELEMAVGTVNHLVSHLVDQGLVERRRAGAPRSSAIARRNQKILALKQQGLTARAIAEKYDLNFETVKSILYEARKRMKD